MYKKRGTILQEPSPVTDIEDGSSGQGRVRQVTVEVHAPFRVCRDKRTDISSSTCYKGF